VAVGLLSVSIPAAFSNVGFALLRLKQHAFTAELHTLVVLFCLAQGVSGLRYAAMCCFA
jgi:hypothetical protein